MIEAKHTPGPWKVMADPVNAGRHPYHDARWIATADAELAHSIDPRLWTLREGRLICEVRDGSTPANARLIAAAPDLLDACRAALSQLTEDQPEYLADDVRQLRAAIAKATGEDS